MSDFPDTVTIGKGLTMTFEPQVRLVKIGGGKDDDTLFVPSHWHEDHDEIMTVLEGKLKVTLGGEVKICTPESGETFIPRGISHSLESLKGVPCVFTERTNPTNFDRKELFFRNLFAIGGMSASMVPAMQVFHHGDMFPVFPGHIKWLEKLVVTILRGYIAALLGYKVKYNSLKRV